MREGWQTKCLGEVATVGAGNSAPQDKTLFEDGTIPFFRTADAGRVRFGDIVESTDYLNDKGVQGLRRFSPGTILFPKSGASTFLNHRVMLGVEGCVSSHLATIVPDEKQAHPRFLLYFLSTIAAQELIQDHAYPSLNLPTIAGIVLHLPPLAEQQRIVGLLDEAFEGLATAKGNAEKNLQNARAIFESHLQSVFSQLGQGWVETRLEEVCGLQNGFAFKSRTFKPSGSPILRISNIQDGRIDAANRIVFFDPNDYRENLDRYRVVKGDLLIAMSGATTGKLGFNTEDKVYYLNQRVGKFEPTDRLDKRFLYHFLSTKVEENLAISAGTAQPNLSTEQIKGFLLPLPSIGEQQRIVDGLETLSAEAQRLTRLYKRKLAALRELKKSLLHKAFNGEL
jgi:type I restriction enzyme S subunit